MRAAASSGPITGSSAGSTREVVDDQRLDRRRPARAIGRTRSPQTWVSSSQVDLRPAQLAADLGGARRRASSSRDRLGRRAGAPARGATGSASASRERGSASSWRRDRRRSSSGDRRARVAAGRRRSPEPAARASTPCAARTVGDRLDGVALDAGRLGGLGASVDRRRRRRPASTTVGQCVRRPARPGPRSGRARRRATRVARPSGTANGAPCSRRVSRAVRRAGGLEVLEHARGCGRPRPGGRRAAARAAGGARPRAAPPHGSPRQVRPRRSRTPCVVGDEQRRAGVDEGDAGWPRRAAPSTTNSTQSSTAPVLTGARQVGDRDGRGDRADQRGEPGVAAYLDRRRARASSGSVGRARSSSRPSCSVLMPRLTSPPAAWRSRRRSRRA